MLNICNFCKKEVKKGNKYCNFTCRSSDPEYRKKIGHPCTPEQLKKTQKTLQLKYGVSNTAAIPSVKKARIKALEENKQEINNKRKEWWDTKADKGKITETKRKTNLKKYGVINVLQAPHVLQKIKKELVMHGVKSYLGIVEENGLRKYENAILKKYGVINYTQSEHFKQMLTERYQRAPDPKKRQEYYNKVVHLTNKNKKYLFETWDGKCHYTGQVLDQTKANRNMSPSIDHKIPVIYGFLNEMPPEEIADISNLCICARYINSSKRTKKYDEFIKEINQLGN